MAERLADWIGRLDRLVFKGTPIEQELTKIHIFTRKLEIPIGYVTKEDSEDGKDHYQLSIYLVEKIKEAKQTIRHIHPDPEKDWKDFPLYTEEEILVAYAAHEVRHRVQYRLPIDLFSPEDKEKTENSFIRFLIEIIENLFKIEPPEGDFEREFDATIIQHLAGEMYHQHENLQQIAKIIGEDTKKLLEREKFPSLFSIYSVCPLNLLVFLSPILVCIFYRFLFGVTYACSSVSSPSIIYNSFMVVCAGDTE
ncbi:MAG TPA: hypothetical protein ENI49_03620 [Thermoplasmatales archaeon]|nr:hypothetical protein [Thermoplasmatales archaeon]